MNEKIINKKHATYEEDDPRAMCKNDQKYWVRAMYIYYSLFWNIQDQRQGVSSEVLHLTHIVVSLKCAEHFGLYDFV